MKFYLSLFLFTILVSCNSNRLEKDELIGTYTYNEGGYKIDLKADGTYRHYYTAGSGNIIEKSGTWELHSFGKEILLKDFSFLTKQAAPSDWNSKLRVEKNKIDLMYDWNDDLYYRRVIKIKK